jgi:excisionase family DNA binding protein
MDNQRTIMRVQDAAAFLGYSIQYLYKLVEARKITVYKPTGRYIFFKREDLEKFIECGKIPANNELQKGA